MVRHTSDILQQLQNGHVIFPAGKNLCDFTEVVSISKVRFEFKGLLGIKELKAVTLNQKLFQDSPDARPLH